ncbi:MAG: glutamine synthetase type III, partial [Planctomycetes bacterium]|nr:glutamine synthetase type III [Planctomycetota bacterium]
GINLLDPGHTPHDNEVFLVTLMCVVRAVAKYSKLLRASVASPANDHRLGANEAPPAIISIFLGDQLQDIVDQLAKGGAKSSKKGGEIKLGVSSLPPLPKDNTDRNRTSPFAFTGNKFEFRMAGSSQSTSGPNFVLNTIVAETMSEMADALEKSKEVNKTAQKLISDWAKEHASILFNGDNYSDAWEKEAAKRGLPNIKNTVDSLATIMEKENVEVLKKHKVLSKGELAARTEILYEFYVNCITIEGRCALNMASRDILPVAIEYAGRLASTVASLKEAGVTSKGATACLKKVTVLVDELEAAIGDLAEAIEKSEADGAAKHAAKCRDLIIPAMNKVRAAADELEMIVDADLWPLPTYAEMLYVR